MEKNASQPNSIEAEESALGSIIIDPFCYPEVRNILKPDMFFLHKHRFIFEAAEALYLSGLDIDFISLSNELSKKNRLGEVGGAAYLTYLIGCVPTSLHALTYAAVIEQQWARRQLLAEATELAKAAYDESLNPFSVAAEHGKRIQERGVLSAGQVIKQEAAFNLYFEHKKEEAESDKSTRRVSTGWRNLDLLLGGGWLLGKLNVLHGHPGYGKTSLLAGGSYREARSGIGVGVFQIEEDAEDWIDIVVNQELGIDRTYTRMKREGASHKQIKQSELDDLARIAERGDVFSNLPMAYYTGGRCSMDTIEREARVMKRDTPNMKVIYIDNMNYIDHQAGRGNESFAIGVCAMRLSSLAKELGAAVVLIAHDNKESSKTDNPPGISDLYMSQAILQTCRTLVCVHPDIKHPKITEAIGRWRSEGITWEAVPYRLHAQKNNKGGLGSCPSFYVPAFQRHIEVQSSDNEADRYVGIEN